VQCKCWAAHREVPPAVIRELSGAISLADEGATRPSRGMVLTTSRFSSGAKEIADQLGFVLIDGSELMQRLGRLQAAPADERLEASRSSSAGKLALSSRR